MYLHYLHFDEYRYPCDLADHAHFHNGRQITLSTFPYWWLPSLEFWTYGPHLAYASERLRRYAGSCHYLFSYMLWSVCQLEQTITSRRRNLKYSHPLPIHKIARNNCYPFPTPDRFQNIFPSPLYRQPIPTLPSLFPYFPAGNPDRKGVV